MLGKFFAAAAAFLLLASCGSKASWPDFQNRFVEQSFAIDPAFAAYQGRHEFDGKLPDWSEEGIAAEIAFLKSSIEEASAFSRLDEQQGFERDYLVAVARGNLFWLETADQPHTNPAYYMGSLDPSVYVTRPYAAADVRLRAYVAYLKEIPRVVGQIRANLRTPMPLSFVDYGKAAFGGLADYYLGDGKAAFASVAEAALQAELTSASAVAAEAMSGLAAWIEAQRPNATQDFALGAERFSQMLRDTEMVDLPLDQLEAIGRADLARNQQALTQACAQAAPGLSLPACMERVNARKPQGGAVAGARAQLTGLRAFIAEHDLVTIPGTEEAQVAESPPLCAAELRLYRHSRSL